MLITVEGLRTRVEDDCLGLVAELQALTGRYGAEEAQAWENSLGRLSQVFQAPSFQPLHLYFGSRGHLAVEYQLPASSSWCDVVLLGAHNATRSAVILELKDWITRGDNPGRYEGLIERQGRQELHPSDQVKGYTQYCRRFHSAVADHAANVHGCVLFTRDRWAAAYSAPPNHELASSFPLFSVAPDDVHNRFPAFFKDRLTTPDEEFANAFARGRYRQSRGFTAQIGAQIVNPRTQVFELLDNQRKAFALCRAVINGSFLAPKSKGTPKKVVIITGPPGSGKSVIAARLWASLVTDPALPDGDVVFATTSLSQNSNWSHLFDRAARLPGAGGVVRKATAYSPITTQQLGELRRRHGDGFLADVGTWRENLTALLATRMPVRDGACDNQNLISIVDEAHGLINPEDPRARGQFGFVISLGPQAYHIIRSSLLTVFLLDPLQGFRQRENTSIDDLREWSRELGAGEPEEISLEGMQFRCAGSTEFVAWVEALLNVSQQRNTPASERAFVAAEPLRPYRVTRSSDDAAPDQPPRMDLQLFENPEQLETALRRRHAEGNSVQLLSSFSREWKTIKATNPHALPSNLMDFHERYEVSGEARVWSRVWNVIGPRDDYSWYVSAHGAGRIAQDPLCEVGCPYAVRGFDYDYVGILWLNDLIWRGGRWRVDSTVVEETGFMSLVTAARGEARRHADGRATTQLLQRVAQAYRILLTRALKGVYVWTSDPETRAHLASAIE
jgi:uncharacterized protein